MVEAVSEGVMSKIVSLAEWSVFKVISMAKEVVSKVVPVAEEVVSPSDGVVSGVWGRQCIQLWAISLG